MSRLPIRTVRDKHSPVLRTIAGPSRMVDLRPTRECPGARQSRRRTAYIPWRPAARSARSRLEREPMVCATDA